MNVRNWLRPEEIDIANLRPKLEVKRASRLPLSKTPLFDRRLRFGPAADALELFPAERVGETVVVELEHRAATHPQPAGRHLGTRAG